MADYKTPGVFVEEISNLPPSIAGASTAIPAFIGYTQQVPVSASNPAIKRVTTLLEFITEFGTASSAYFSVNESTPSTVTKATTDRYKNKVNDFSLYYAISHYFKNGGGPCYVVSVGSYTDTPSKANFETGLSALEKEDEPTLIVLTDAACLLNAGDYYSVCTQAMAQCKKLGDRFTIVDVVGSSESLRNGLSTNLDYGAAYTPNLQTSINYSYDEDKVTIDGATTNSGWEWRDADSGLTVSYGGSVSSPRVKILVGEPGENDVTFTLDETNSLTISNVGSTSKTSHRTASDILDAWNNLSPSEKPSDYSITVSDSASGGVNNTTTFQALSSVTSTTESTLRSIADSNTNLNNQIKQALSEQRVTLPPSAAVAGVYARVDREQGVWKAPANVGLRSVIGPVEKINDEQQEALNIDPTAGKSINAIRAFTGKGTLVWGARTLKGNDNEWRYVPVRRLFITIEESVKKATAFAVFEPNVQLTWLKVKSMIESYLYGMWQKGALAGTAAADAYYVNVGLGTTMAPQDVLEGRMNVEIGIAAVRPAEFIILKFSHKLQTT